MRWNRWTGSRRRGRQARRGGAGDLLRARPWLEALEDRLAPATLTVTSNDDSLTPPPGTLNLRNAIAAAGPGDTITFSPGLGTITLELGSLDLTKSLTIQGPSGGITVAADPNAGFFSVFTVSASAADTINGLTISGGTAAQGAGIFNSGVLTLNGDTLSGNTAFEFGDPSESGGAVYNDTGAVLSVTNSILTGNSAFSFGGGIENFGTVLLSGSTLSNNDAGGGGGVDNHGSLTVINSTFSNNNGGNSNGLDGGGIRNESALSVGNSTFTTNYAFRYGGGIFNDLNGTATITASTFAGNYGAQLGGGISNLGGLVQVTGSTFDSNFAGFGGGVDNTGTMAVSLSTFLNNTSGSDGAAAANAGTLTLTATTLANNIAGQNGGGLAASAGTATLVDVTVTNNRAGAGPSGGNGGGIFVTVPQAPQPQPQVILGNTLVAGNFNGPKPSTTPDDVFGALYLGSRQNIIGDGTGIQPPALGNLMAQANPGDTTLQVYDATPFFAGMVLHIESEDVIVTGVNAPQQTLTVTRGANGTTAATHLINTPVLFTTVADGDLNGNVVGVIGSNPNVIDPLVAIVANYGGPTATTALLPGSPAIDTGARIALAFLSTPAPGSGGSTVLHVNDPTPFAPGMVLLVDAEEMLVTAVGVSANTVTVTRAVNGTSPAGHLGGAAVFLGTDQRGTSLLNPPGGAVDVGAFESQGFVLSAFSGSGQQRIIDTQFADPLVVAVSSPFGEPVAGGAVTFTAPSTGPSASFNPNPVTIDPSGTASGFATANGVVGTYQVTATTAGAAGSVSFTLTNNFIIFLTPATLPDWTVNQPGYSQTLVPSGGTGAITLNLTSGPASLPPGLTFDASTGILSGTPTTTGVYTFTITGTDAGNQTGSQTYTVTINPPVTVPAAVLPGSNAHVPNYNASITATGGTGAYTFAVTGGTLPPGLTLDPALGTITGIPTTVGTFNFTVTATDVTGASGSHGFSIVIAPGIAINPATLPNWTVSQGVYAQQLTATGATGTVTFAVTSGFLPTGLSLDSTTGLLGGTPISTGTFNFTVTATDSATQAFGVQPYTVVINPVPSLNLTNPPTGTVGEIGYSFTLGVSGGTAPFTFTKVGGTLPSNLSNPDPTTGTISGTPLVSGSFTFTVKVTDSTGASDIATYSLLINKALLITTPSLPDGTLNQAYSRTIATQFGTGADTFQVTAGALPDGLGLNPNTGVVSGTPTKLGTFNFTVTARDSVGTPASQSYTVAINPALGIGTTSLPGATTFLAYNQTITTSGGTAPLAFTVTAGSLPAGLTLDQASGVLGGTPTAAGTFNFTVKVTDAAGASASQALTLNVTELGNGIKATPALVSLASPTVLVGTGAVTLSGKVTFPGLVPTGTVAVVVNGAQVTATVGPDGSFAASFPAAGLAGGVYTVRYTYTGDTRFLPVTGTGTLQVVYGVVGAGGAHSVKSGKAIALGVILTNASGKNVSSAGTPLTVLGLNPTSIPGLVVPVQPADRASSSGRFHFKRRGKHGGSYQFSLRTRGLAPGAYSVLFMAGADPVPHAVTFIVR
jgi:hypothetical protein